MASVSRRWTRCRCVRSIIVWTSVLTLWTTLGHAECNDPSLFRELAEISIHSDDSRLKANRELMAECNRDMRREHMSHAQRDLKKLQLQFSVQKDHDRIHHHDHAPHDTSRFVAVDDVFPPQPAAMENVIWDRHNRSASTSPLSRTTSDDVARRSENVRAALGERFAYIGSESLASKGDKNNQQVRVTYFSHSLNMTVEVVIERGSIITIHSISPDMYQPPLTELEVAEAVRIARDTLLAEGRSRVAHLQGYTILALPTEDGAAFFPHRVGYVSFHTDADARPEYVAWVDLTNQVVIESREE